MEIRVVSFPKKGVGGWGDNYGLESTLSTMVLVKLLGSYCRSFGQLLENFNLVNGIIKI